MKTLTQSIVCYGVDGISGFGRTLSALYTRAKTTVGDLLSEPETPIFVEANPHAPSSQTLATRPIIWDPRRMFTNLATIFSEPETPIFMKALENPDFRNFQDWCSDVKQSLREIKTRLDRGGVDPRLFRAAFLEAQTTITENLISPFYYYQQLLKLEKKIIEDPKLPNVFADIIREAQVRFREQLKENSEVAMNCFYDDLIHYLIQFSGKQIETDELNALLNYYDGLIDQALHQAIKQRIEIFLGEAQDYYERYDDPQIDILFISLPNRMIEGVVKDIDTMFDQFENNTIEQNEPVQTETVTELMPAGQHETAQQQSYFQQLKTYWQAGYEYAKENPKTILTATASAAALGYVYYSSNKEHSYTLTAPQFPQWTMPAWQATNIFTNIATTYAFSYATFGREFAMPTTLTGTAVLIGVLSSLRYIKAQPLCLTQVGLLSGFLGAAGEEGAIEVALSANYAFVVDNRRHFRVVDISNVSQPFFVGLFNSSSSTRGVAVFDNYIFLAAHSGGLKILDVSNKSNPFLVGVGDTAGQYASRVALSKDGNYAYVPAWWAGLMTFDVSNKASPVRTSWIQPIPAGNAAQEVAHLGNFTYLVDSNAGLWIYDVTVKTSPSFVGHLNKSTGTYLWDVVVDGDYAYLANSIGLEIVDVRNKSNPFFIGSYDTPSLAPSRGVFLLNPYVIIGDYGGGIYVFDVSNKSNPILLGSFEQGGGWGIAARDNYIYAPDGPVFRIIKLSNCSTTSSTTSSISSSTSPNVISSTSQFFSNTRSARTSTKVSSTRSKTTTDKTTHDISSSTEPGSNVILILGIVLGGVCGSALLSLPIIYFVRRKLKGDREVAIEGDSIGRNSVELSHHEKPKRQSENPYGLFSKAKERSDEEYANIPTKKQDTEEVIYANAPKDHEDQEYANVPQDHAPESPYAMTPARPEEEEQTYALTPSRVTGKL